MENLNTAFATFNKKNLINPAKIRTIEYILLHFILFFLNRRIEKHLQITPPSYMTYKV